MEIKPSAQVADILAAIDRLTKEPGYKADAYGRETHATITAELAELIARAAQPVTIGGVAWCMICGGLPEDHRLTCALKLICDKINAKET